MKTQWLLVLAVSCSVALAGCASTGMPPTSPPTGPIIPSVGTPESTADSQLTITLDNIEFRQFDMVQLVSLTDGASIVTLFESITGITPAEEFIPFPDTDGLLYGTSYEWDDVKVIVYVDGGPSAVTFLAPTVNDVPVRTQDGISVGSTRAEVIAARGWVDVEGPPEVMGLGSREVPGTTSLDHSGSVGIEYILLVINDNIVHQISVPANDYSDI